MHIASTIVTHHTRTLRYCVDRGTIVVAAVTGLTKVFVAASAHKPSVAEKSDMVACFARFLSARMCFFSLWPAAPALSDHSLAPAHAVDSST